MKGFCTALRVIHGFQSNWVQHLLKVQSLKSHLPCTQIPVVCKCFMKFCLQTSETHAHNYKTHVRGGFSHYISGQTLSSAHGF